MGGSAFLGARNPGKRLPKWMRRVRVRTCIHRSRCILQSWQKRVVRLSRLRSDAVGIWALRALIPLHPWVPLAPRYPQLSTVGALHCLDSKQFIQTVCSKFFDGRCVEMPEWTGQEATSSSEGWLHSKSVPRFPRRATTIPRTALVNNA